MLVPIYDEIIDACVISNMWQINTAHDFLCLLDTRTSIYEGKKQRTDTSLDELLKYLKKVLPARSLCPTSVEEAKKIVCPLDLPSSLEVIV